MPTTKLPAKAATEVANVTDVTDEMDQQVQKIIKKYSAIAVSAGFVPVPLLDLATLAGIQLKAIHEIGKVHGMEFKENAGKSTVVSALAVLSANPVSRIAGSLLKVVPVIGGALSLASFHAYAAGSTYAMGNLFHRHFSNGGTILDFNAQKVKGAYSNLVSKFKSKEKEVVAVATPE